MSMHQAGDRGRGVGRGRLVLLRGGRDVRPSDREDAEWATFCARIGWSEPSHDLSAEDERLLVNRLLDTLDREVGSAGRRVAWARRVLVASTMLAVAAALCVIVAATLSWQAHTAARAAAQRDPDTQRAPERAPEIAPVEKAQPLTDEAPDGPKKSPTKAPKRRDDTTQPPGAIASVQNDRVPNAEASPIAVGGAVIASSDRATVQASPHDVKPVALHRDDARNAERSFAMPTSTALAFASTPSHVLSSATSRDAAWSPASFDAADVASATWSIAPAGDRWYGAALPPAPGSATLPGGIGVVAQLDIGKAIAQF